MPQKLITFEVNNQLFGLDIMLIREIRVWTPTTPVPHAPDYMAGVINLRGTILPVIDLAVRLGWEATEPSPRNAIIVTFAGGQLRGLIVGSVSDIVSVPDDGMQPPPDAAGGSCPFLEGLAAIEDRMFMILDLNALYSEDEMETVS